MKEFEICGSPKFNFRQVVFDKHSKKEMYERNRLLKDVALLNNKKLNFEFNCEMKNVEFCP